MEVSSAETRVWALGHGPIGYGTGTPNRHDAGPLPIVLKGTASGPPGTLHSRRYSIRIVSSKRNFNEFRDAEAFPVTDYRTTPDLTEKRQITSENRRRNAASRLTSAYRRAY